MNRLTIIFNWAVKQVGKDTAVMDLGFLSHFCPKKWLFGAKRVQKQQK